MTYLVEYLMSMTQLTLMKILLRTDLHRKLSMFLQDNMCNIVRVCGFRLNFSVHVLGGTGSPGAYQQLIIGYVWGGVEAEF